MPNAYREGTEGREPRHLENDKGGNVKPGAGSGGIFLFLDCVCSRTKSVQKGVAYRS